TLCLVFTTFGNKQTTRVNLTNELVIDFRSNFSFYMYNHRNSSTESQYNFTLRKATMFTVGRIDYPIPPSSNRILMTADEITLASRALQTMVQMSDTKAATATFSHKVQGQVAEVKTDKSILSDYLSSQPKSMKSTAAGKDNSKNEAEIADSLIFNKRRSSLPSFTTLGGQGQYKRKGSLTDSIDRELRSMCKNSIEERRLLDTYTELDKQSFVGSQEHRFQKKQIFKDHKKMLKRSPAAEEWLNRRKARTNMWQEREREEIAKRYSRRARHFRAPPDLQETVAKIRSYAMAGAGVLQSSAPEYSEANGDDFEEVSSKLVMLNLARRHSGDNLDTALPKLDKMGKLAERRMTLGDIKAVKDVLEFRSLSSTRVYLEDLQKSRLHKDCSNEHEFETSSRFERSETSKNATETAEDLSVNCL
ncbi:uncharacterized protein LOC131953013, partial [Physella acuta]|uniref:uncharacterized protein LOC131953013 n=1 Tax=Physella acuta TaxID=109671 RepID=UPI0027DE0715